MTESALVAGAIAVPTIVPSSVFGAHAPSNRITIGLIGMGRQMIRPNLPQFLKLPDAQVVAVCDVDAWRMEEGRKAVDVYYWRRPANRATGDAQRTETFARF